MAGYKSPGRKIVEYVGVVEIALRKKVLALMDH